MSFRELRSFTETLRTLGFVRKVSMENFRVPNFPLVAEIVSWLLHKYDPSIDIPVEIDTEDQRVSFVRNVAHLLFTHAHIRISTSRLYGADGFAVKEMLKISNVLRDALRLKNNPSSDHDMEIGRMDAKGTRSIASELTRIGAELSKQLDKEVSLRETRESVASQPFELDEVEGIIRESIAETEDQRIQLNQRIQRLSDDGNILEEKIERKKAELARAKKRLKSYENIRPGFMDEHEKLEKELQGYFAIYCEKFRTLQYLENQKQKFDEEEAERIQASQNKLAQLRERLRDQERQLLEGDMVIDEDLMDTTDARHVREARQMRRPGAASGKRRPNQPNNRVVGSMSGGEDDDSMGSDLSGLDDNSSDGEIELSGGNLYDDDIASDDGPMDDEYRF